MSTKNFIGLELNSVQLIVDGLNDLLANHQVYYTNLRGLHWDIQGDKFYELHELYEEYYNNEASAIDEIAERIVMLGEHPENRFSEYIKISGIKEISGVSDWETGLNHVIASLKTLLEKSRNILKLAFAANDSGTVSLVSKLIKDTETNLWKLTAYMK
ncbi:MAG: DNA starvation/stationary phase protection protein [Tannerella sp.]|jgi:starvation-inducible DNA-binding protein|nr:DNA starvation/stationary phase protection protein [Tannerella sp.]